MATKAKNQSVEEWLDQLDPADPSTKVRDGRHLRRIRQAADAYEDAEQELRAAVAESRAAGDSWGVIGMVLGVSRQAAQQRLS